MSRRLGAITILLAAVAAAAGLLASKSSGAQTTRTIGLITRDGGDSFFTPVETGGQAAATALGDHLAVTRADDATAQISTIKSLIRQHAAAIAIDIEDGGTGTSKQVLPVLAQARAAGIPTVGYGIRAPGSLWISPFSQAQFAHALGDALASQMDQRGRFVIVSCLRSAGANPVVRTWLQATEAYMPRRYPRMHRVGVAYGDLGNGTVDTHMFRRLTQKYSHLRGLIFLCPGESYIVPEQLIQANEVGKVFSSGNGGDCPPVEEPFRTYVQSGAEEIVCQGDPTQLGYLTVWAADYLASGHTFAPGSYDVGGPVGTVHYHRHHQELRLGQPLTITKTNLAQYAGQHQ